MSSLQNADVVHGPLYHESKTPDARLQKKTETKKDKLQFTQPTGWATCAKSAGEELEKRPHYFFNLTRKIRNSKDENSRSPRLHPRLILL